MYSIKEHLLYKDGVQVSFVESPNQSGNINPRFIIQHFTADLRKGQAVNWLKSPDSKVSAHLVIELDGTVIQMVKFNKKSWHAGASNYDGLEGLNSFSIGIENVNPGRVAKIGDKFFVGKVEVPKENVVWLKHKNESKEAYWYVYPEQQLKVIEEVTKVIAEYYGITKVLGHDDISPNRKNDPGPAFPMKRIRDKIQISEETGITTSNLNLRIEAGADYKVIEVIPKNTKVKILVKSGLWFKVEYQNKLGWVSSKYLIYK